MTTTQHNWYFKNSAGDCQGTVIEEQSGRTVAVAYDKADAPLLAAAPKLREALQNLFDDWTTLVGQDLRENNADVKKLWHETESALNETEAA